MSRPVRVCPVLLCVATWLSAQKKPVTIDSITQQPPERRAAAINITWAPDGKRFAYREQNQLWLYDAASGQKRELVSLAALKKSAVKVPSPERFQWQNRRLSTQPFQWSASGKQMLISAGGDLFLLDIASGKWEQLTSTPETERDPKLSPNGRFVSFRRGHDLYSMEVAGRKVTRLTADGSATLLNGELDWVYPEELEISTAHWWSPDSRYIAYLQLDIHREPVFPQADLLALPARLEPQRYPYAGDPNAEVRVGILPAQGGPSRWMDLGETRDSLIARLQWLPSSRAVAIERLNRVQNRLDLLLADIETGAARPLVREQDPYWININDHFRFLEDGQRFLWGSERDGFCHLYLYSIDGGVLRQLTSGEWEVKQLAGVNESQGEVFFVSSEESPLERHLYRVSLNGGRRRRLTATAGTHTISMSPTCDFYLDTVSSLTAPPRATLHTSHGAGMRVFRESDRKEAEEYEILATQIVPVRAADGALLYARMIKPARFDPAKKYPVIVIIYGGPHAQSVRNLWSGASWDQALAHRGFLIWQLDNRGSSGRGHKWESAVFRNLGAHELEDQKQGIHYLESLGFADTARMGIYGWSYGGYMTLYTLLNAPGLFRAGIAGAPVTDWRTYDSIYTERYMGLPNDNADGYRRSSPLNKAGDLTASLMLIHNLEDDNVHFQNTLRMAGALERAGKRFQMLIYPQKAHAVSGPERRHMLETMTAFFEENLK